ncbi:ribose-phosphate pyrophosphokinase, putative [Perkinsus marinus ATCC 50983]|uniref:ribose-phosphate diphosphokinase n=1 Tax=Perkinsus marinus (strain ATCC 50983 / TXsc) TaxID=423536 RepID=C5KDQ9_PERM5|nr:ribose-phosphate pyrophosphokinase, putative [Perkinsus marinus ATCC 50983]EER17362.1 ribose-phosphate pyrophosphokinase, putative [Perkinsus marinus ATCC 50983]|eukprot:XP_002785566.1 ribose-phosphate pyrophosphokinase, putative [Perkinsus marinus ATCC 50983]
MLPWMTRAMASVRGSLRTSSKVALWKRLAGRKKFAEAGTGIFGVAVAMGLLATPMGTACLEEKKKEKWSSYIRGLITSSPSPAADEYASATADNESGPPRPQEESLRKAVDDEELESEETEEYYVDPGKHEYMKVFACSDSEQLASEICANLGTTEGRAYTGKFADGEIIVDIVDEVRGQDCFIIQQFPISKKSGVSRSRCLHDAIMESCLMISALRRASAKSITLITPYFAYGRHMESEGVAGDPAVTQPATPLAASDIALMYEAMGVDRVVAVDLHEGSLEGCFDVPVTNIDPLGLPLKYFLSKDLHNPVVVSPDNTASDRAFLFWRRLQNHGVNCGLATMVSNRKSQLAERSPDEGVTMVGRGSVSNEPLISGKPHLSADGTQVIMPSGWKKSIATLVTKDWLVGDVEGRDCIIVDDIIDSGKRMSRTVEELRQHGARRIYMYATHGVLSPAAMERINRRGVTEVVITNSLPFPEQARKCEKIRVLSLGQVLAEVMLRIYEQKSVSQMFWDNQKKEGSKRPSGTATV